MIVNYVTLILIVDGVQAVKCVYQVENKEVFVLIHHQDVQLMNGSSRVSFVKQVIEEYLVLWQVEMKLRVES